MSKALRLSETVKLPVLLRTTTRVNHAVGEVTPSGNHDSYDAIPFKKDPQRYVRASMSWNRLRHAWLLERLATVPAAADTLQLDIMYSSAGSKGPGFITAGATSNYVLDALEELGLKCEVLKLGLLNPLDSEEMTSFLRRKPKVLVVEETDSYLEDKIKAIAQSSRI